MMRVKPCLLVSFFLVASFASAQSVLIRVQEGNNVSLIPNGGNFAVNATGVGRPQTFSLTITYRGATTLTFPGTPQIYGIQDFSFTVPPVSDMVLRPNQSLTLELEYRPSSSEAAFAQLDYQTLESAPAPPEIPNQPPLPTPAPTPGGIIIGLLGSAPEYSLNYGLAVDGNIVNVPPSGVVQFTETAVNRVTSAAMILLNRGSGRGRVHSVFISGPAFSLFSLPLLPAFLQSGTALQFEIRYRPRQPGIDRGSLLITFEDGQTYMVVLQGTGLDSLLTYELLPPDGETSFIQPNQVIPLPDTPVGERSTVFIRLTNNSTLDIAVANIVVAGAAFQLSDLPFLPVTMAPGEQQYFTLIFRPTEPGRQTGRLRVGNDSFELLGNRDTPEPLPSYTLEGPVTVQPFAQPTVSLTLAEPYSVALRGTLTLTTESESFASDPSVQFVTGGQVVIFTIPVGATRAVFPNGATAIRFQTGSAAGTIVVTPFFVTEEGLDLTPDNPPTLRAVLAAASPHLLSLNVDGRTTNSFVLQAAGYATTRSLSSLTVTFTGRPGYNFPRTEFTQDLTVNSFLWFNSQASTGFGGQFVLQLPFSLRASSGNTSPIEAIESVTLTVSNERGDSNTLSVQLQ